MAKVNELTEETSLISDEEGEPEPEVALTAVEGDLYGATLVSTVIALRDEHWGELIVAWVRIFANLFFQFGITYAVWKYINKDKMNTFYPVATKSHVFVTRLETILANDGAVSGAILSSANSTDAEIISLCNTLPHSYFMLIVWFLWSAKIISELWSTYHFFKQVFRVPVYTRVKIEDGKDGAVNIMALTTLNKAAFLFLLVVPKFFIGLFLWWAGIEFLALATDMGTLILKVFTLQFVLTLDELLFDAFLATDNKARVKSSKVNDYKGGFPGWIDELIKAALCVILMIIAHWYFHDIQEVRNACWNCVRDCSKPCAQAFDFCDALEL